MSVKIQVVGIPEAQKSMRMIGLEITKGNKETVKETALRVEGRAKELCPVDTGRLRASIAIMDYKEEPAGALVGTNVVYGVYQEFGTFKMAAQPYLRPAAMDAQGFHKALAEKKVRDAIKKGLQQSTGLTRPVSVAELFRMAKQTPEFGTEFESTIKFIQ